MSDITIGNILITCDNGTVTIDDPRRESPFILKCDDFPLVLDVLDSVEWDRRGAFRVPTCDSPLLTVIECSGIDHAATAVNISMTGILVKLAQSDTPELSINDAVNVTVQLDDIRTTLPAVVRHCTGHLYGIVFPALLGNGGVDPPVALQWIVNQLESQWLARRIHSRTQEESRSVFQEVDTR